MAAEFINRRIPGTKVVAHNCMIQDFDEQFYRKFQIIVCGLVSLSVLNIQFLNCKGSETLNS